MAITNLASCLENISGVEEPELTVTIMSLRTYLERILEVTRLLEVKPLSQETKSGKVLYERNEDIKGATEHRSDLGG